MTTLQIDIDSLLRAYGIKGLLIALGVAALYGLGNGIKTLALMIKNRLEASDKVLTDVVSDARAERDAARQQREREAEQREREVEANRVQREREANAFLASLKEQSAETRRGFDEVLRELRDGSQQQSRRK